MSKAKNVTLKLTQDQLVLAMSAVAYMQDIVEEDREFYHALNGLGEVLAIKTEQTWKELRAAIHSKLAEGEQNDEQNT